MRVPLCASHWSMRVRSRRAAMAVGVAGMLSIATLLIGRLSGAAVPAMIVLGAALLFVSRFMNRAASPLRLARVQNGCLYLAGAGTAYLESLGSFVPPDGIGGMDTR